MPESDIEFPFSHTGEFTIGTGLQGAPTLKAILSVPRNSSTVTGHGLLTQAINPPLHATTAFHGLVTLEVFGGQNSSDVFPAGSPVSAEDWRHVRQSTFDHPRRSVGQGGEGQL